MTHIKQFRKTRFNQSFNSLLTQTWQEGIMESRAKIPASLLKYYSIIKQEIRGHPSINWLVSIVLFR